MWDPRAAAKPLKLYVEYHDYSVEVGGADSLALGRGGDNRRQLDSSRVSRHHAIIEARGTGFCLIDQSTNGTYLRKGELPPVLVRHETHTLSGEGILVLGQQDDPEGQTTLKFRVTV
jgi:adenylate cyclase